MISFQSDTTPVLSCLSCPAARRCVGFASHWVTLRCSHLSNAGSCLLCATVFRCRLEFIC